MNDVHILELPASRVEPGRRAHFRRVYPGELAVLECAWAGWQPASVIRLTTELTSDPLRGMARSPDARPRANERAVAVIEVLRNCGGDTYPLAFLQERRQTDPEDPSEGPSGIVSGIASGTPPEVPLSPSQLPASMGPAFREVILGEAAPESHVLIPADDAWAGWIEGALGPGAAERIPRRHFEGHPVPPDPLGAHPETAAVDAELAVTVAQRFGDHVFDSWGGVDGFLQHGFGTVGLLGNDRTRPVSMCLSYAVGGGAAEIDVATLPDHRRAGWGYRTTVAFVAQCAQRGLRPTWSCRESNDASQALAVRLGFRRAQTYLWMPVDR